MVTLPEVIVQGVVKVGFQTPKPEYFILYDFIRTFHFPKLLYFSCLCLSIYLNVSPSIHPSIYPCLCQSTYPVIHLMESVKVLITDIICFIVLQWCVPFFRNWKQDLPPARRSQLALLRYSLHCDACLLR